MSFEDHWEDYNFRDKCNLNAPAFYRPQVFDFNEVRSIARHAYNAGQEDITLKGGIVDKKLCEVNINFKIPKDKIQHIYNARDELAKAGVTFDTGGCSDGDYIKYDWEFDWSLKGDVEVSFRKYKD